MLKEKMIIHQIYKKQNTSIIIPLKAEKALRGIFFAFGDKIIAKKEKRIKTHFRAFYGYVRKSLISMDFS